MSESLFGKVAGLKAYNFDKKQLLHSCFPVNIAKFLRTALFTEHLWWLLLYLFSKVTGLKTSNVIKRLQQKCLPVKFAKVLRTPFSQNTSGGCFWTNRDLCGSLCGKVMLWSFSASLSYLFRSSHSEVYLVKGVLKICSKFTREHPCWSAISIKLQSMGELI